MLGLGYAGRGSCIGRGEIIELRTSAARPAVEHKPHTLSATPKACGGLDLERRRALKVPRPWLGQNDRWRQALGRQHIEFRDHRPGRPRYFGQRAQSNEAAVPWNKRHFLFRLAAAEKSRGCRVFPTGRVRRR